MIIGLTGNMGSGKSMVSGLLAEMGAAIIDADSIGHQVLLPDGAAYASVLSLFGAGFLNEDGQLDRRRLGAYVFAEGHSERLQLLESVTHPAIVEEIERRIARYRAEGVRLIVIEAALFFGTPLVGMVDQIWAVVAPRPVLLERIMARDGYDIQEASERLSRQLPPEELARLSHKVLVNDGTREDLVRALRRAVAELKLDD